jgi:hypothetical protein
MFILLVLDAAVTIPNDILTEVAPMLLFQFICWSVGFLIIVHTPTKQRLRLCDPGPLIFALLLLYCIYPSLTWCRFQRLPFNVALSTSDGNLLFMLHGLLFLGIAIGYRISRCVRPAFMDHVSTRLPSPLPLLIAVLSVLAITTISRVASGGQVIPDINYGTNWTTNFDQANNSRIQGGASYVYTQILSKISSYPTTALGIGCGLVLARALRTRRKLLRTIGFIGLLALVTYLFGDGQRSPTIISTIIAIMFADAIAGPLRVKSIGPAIAVLLLGFLFAGYFRAYREYGIADAARLAVADLQQNDEQYTAGEFTGMIAKEAAMLDRYRNQGSEGVTYFYESVFALIPSQLVPQKLSWQATPNLLSEQFLGRAFADKGAGVAGATIGDGLRLAGLLGVPILGLLFGSIFGLVQRWSFRIQARVPDQPVLLKIALASAFYGMAFVVVRGSLGEVIVYLFYGVVLPWLVLSILMQKRSPWLYGTSAREDVFSALPAMVARVGGIRPPWHHVSR